MRKSEERTKVAVLRQAIGLSAKDFADLIAKTIHTVKSLESGRLKLSEELAVRISKATGVLLDWLLAPPHPDDSPIDQFADELTRETFEAHRAALMAMKKAHDSYKQRPAEATGKQLVQLLKKAEKLPNYDLVIWRVGRFMRDLQREFLSPQEHDRGLEDEFHWEILHTGWQERSQSSGSKKKRP